MQKGDKVTYSQPFEDERDVEYTVIEVDEAQDWCKIQANLNMAINPVYVANISELTIK